MSLSETRDLDWRDLDWVEDRVIGLLREMRPGPLTERLQPLDSLFESGVLDSLGIIQLIQMMERRFSIQIDYAKVRFENFQTARSISQFLIEECGLKCDRP
jgi:acyl carrier protein